MLQVRDTGALCYNMLEAIENGFVMLFCFCLS